VRRERAEGIAGRDGEQAIRGDGAAGRVTLAMLLSAALAVLIAAALWLLLRDTAREVVADRADAAVLHPAAPTDDTRGAELPPLPDLPAPAAASVEPLTAAAPPEDDENDARHSARVVERSEKPRADGEPRAACTFVAVDPQDNPVPGASVEVWGDSGDPAEREWKLFASLSTDGEGRATVSPPDLRPTVRIHRQGIGCSGMVSFDNLASRGGEPRLVVVPLQPEIRVTGDVLRSGIHGLQPAPHAAVRIARPGNLPASAEHLPPSLAADANGAFELTAHAADDVMVQAADDAFATRWVHLQQALPRGGHLVLRLPSHQWRVRGRLVDMQGVPISGSTIVFRSEADGPVDPSAEHGEDPPARISDFTGSAGEFELWAPESGRGWLLLDSAQYVLDAPVAVTVDEQHPVVEVTLVACAHAVISGRVVDRAGAGLQGVTVHAEPVRLGDRPAELPPWLGDIELLSGSDARTAADGSFTLD
jgi:hypothetical protein